MKLDLQAFDAFPAHARIEADPGGFEFDSDIVVGVRKAALDLDIQNSGEEYYCQGSLQALVTLECARCLAPFDAELSESTDFIVCSADAFATLGNGEDGESYVLLEGSGMEADLRSTAQQALVVALPMKPLCRPDCRGICPQCGVNRNRTSCECSTERADPRWDGLQQLFGNN